MSIDTARTRQPAGTPAGGEFTTSPKPEADGVELAPAPVGRTGPEDAYVLTVPAARALPLHSGRSARDERRARV